METQLQQISVKLDPLISEVGKLRKHNGSINNGSSEQEELTTIIHILCLFSEEKDNIAIVYHMLLEAAKHRKTLLLQQYCIDNQLAVLLKQHPMRAKAIHLKAKEKSPTELSLEECRNMFKAEEYGYTDEELIQMRNFLFKLAKIYYEFYMTTLRHRAKVIPLNHLPYGTEESNSLCTG